MNLEQFRATLGDASPPAVDPPLQALWWAAKGDWDKAHGCAQAGDDPSACWVHAYLHRDEGDLANAGYWYSRAGRKISERPLELEWAEIAEAALVRQCTDANR